MAIINHDKFLNDLRADIYPFYEAQRNALEMPDIADRTDAYLNSQEGGESVFKANRASQMTHAGIAAGVALMGGVTLFTLAMSIGLAPIGILLGVAGAATFFGGVGKMAFHLDREAALLREQELFSSLSKVRLTELLETHPQEMMRSEKFRSKLVEQFGLAAYVTKHDPAQAAPAAKPSLKADI